MSDRWCLREKKGKLKARQRSTDLDLLMEHAGAINEKFQDLVSFQVHQERMSETGFNALLINVQADYVRSLLVCVCVCVCKVAYIQTTASLRARVSCVLK